MATCKYCGATIEGGRADKQFCDDAHKQRYWRRKQKEEQDAALDAELKTLRTKVADLEQRNEELTRDISRLHDRLNIEKRYLQEKSTRKYGFRAFIKKQPATPLIEKLLADPFTMPRDTRAHYEYRLPLLHCTEEERQEFTDLWKLMMLQQP